MRKGILLGVFLCIFLVGTGYAKDIPILTVNNGTDEINTTERVGYWPLSDNLDYSGYNNDGTVNGATSTSNGRLGNAYNFDGDNDYIEIENELPNMTTLSVSAWVKVSDNSSSGSIVTRWDATDDQQNFILRAHKNEDENRFRFIIMNSSDSQNYTESPDETNEDVWYHVVGTYNSSGYINLYVNGVLKDSHHLGGNPNSVTENTMIGANDDSSQVNFFDGIIDEAVIYNRSLDESEIQMMYNSASHEYSTSTDTFTFTADTSSPTFTIERNTTNASAENATATTLPAGYWYYNFSTAGDGSWEEVEILLPIYITEAPETDLSLSASPSWTTTPSTSVTVTCDGDIARILYKNGTTVSNPFTASYTEATYNFTCVSNDNNYTDHYVNNNLVISSSFSACTDTDTYAFSKTFTPDGDLLNLNFTDLVGSGFVRGDLTDVSVDSSIPNTWKNLTDGYYIVVNVTGISSFDVDFGNYYIDTNSYTNHNRSENTSNVEDYDSGDYYYFISFYNENGTAFVPSGTNNTMDLYCSNGQSSFDFSNETIIIASLIQLDEIRAKVEYSAGSFYYRNLLVDSPVEYRNLYLVDAVQTEVLQIILSLDDRVGDFDESELKMKKNIINNLETITELNFDAENKAIVYLINGDKYSIYVDNGDEERNIGYLYADSSDLTKTIIMGELNITNMTTGNISLSLTYTSGTVSFTWNDPSNKTDTVEFWVYNHSSGEELYSASSTNRSTVSFTYITPVENSTYRVKYLIHHDVYGNNTWGGIQILRGIGVKTTPTDFPLSDLITGLGGDSDLWMAFLLILPVPLLFSKRYAGIGSVVLVSVVALFAYWEIYPVDSVVVLPVALFVAVIGFIRWLRREDR